MVAPASLGLHRPGQDPGSRILLRLAECDEVREALAVQSWQGFHDPRCPCARAADRLAGKASGRPGFAGTGPANAGPIDPRPLRSHRPARCSGPGRTRRAAGGPAERGNPRSGTDPTRSCRRCGVALGGLRPGSRLQRQFDWRPATVRGPGHVRWRPARAPREPSRGRFLLAHRGLPPAQICPSRLARSGVDSMPATVCQRSAVSFARPKAAGRGPDGRR